VWSAEEVGDQNAVPPGNVSVFLKKRLLHLLCDLSVWFFYTRGRDPKQQNENENFIFFKWNYVPLNLLQKKLNFVS
jgi:hypothetical protein